MPQNDETGKSDALPLRDVSIEEFRRLRVEGDEVRKILYEEFRPILEITGGDLSLILR
jgi:hypothetical protein